MGAPARPCAEAGEATDTGERLKAEGVWLLRKGNECAGAPEKLRYYREARDAFVRARAVLPGDRSIALQIDKIDLGMLDLARMSMEKGKGGPG